MLQPLFLSSLAWYVSSMSKDLSTTMGENVTAASSSLSLCFSVTSPPWVTFEYPPKPNENVVSDLQNTEEQPRNLFGQATSRFRTFEKPPSNLQLCFFSKQLRFFEKRHQHRVQVRERMNKCNSFSSPATTPPLTAADRHLLQRVFAGKFLEFGFCNLSNFEICF